MKRLIFVFIVLFALVSVQAQITTIRESQAVTQYGGTGDTLNLDGSVTDTWYIKDFSKGADIFWNVDSVSGTPSFTMLLEYSYNNSDWITSNSTTLTPVVGDTTFVQQVAATVRPVYIRSSLTAITNAQNIRYQRVAVLEKNQ